MANIDEQAGLVYTKRYGNEWQSMFQVGVQYFHIGPRYETEAEAQWMSDQFTGALAVIGVEIVKTDDE